MQEGRIRSQKIKDLSLVQQLHLEKQSLFHHYQKAIFYSSLFLFAIFLQLLDHDIVLGISLHLYLLFIWSFRLQTLILSFSSVLRLLPSFLPYLLTFFLLSFFDPSFQQRCLHNFLSAQNYSFLVDLLSEIYISLLPTLHSSLISHFLLSYLHPFSLSYFFSSPNFPASSQSILHTLTHSLAHSLTHYLSISLHPFLHPSFLSFRPTFLTLLH